MFWTMLICDLLVPIILVIVGLIMYKFPPKKINFFVGYRTNNSMKNDENWEFANKYSAKLLFICGCILFVLSLLVHIPFYNSSEDVLTVLSIVLCSLQCVSLFICVFLTEKKLKKRVDLNE